MTDAERTAQLEPFRELAKRYREREATCRGLATQSAEAADRASYGPQSLYNIWAPMRDRLLDDEKQQTTKAAVYEEAANDLEQLISQQDKPASGKGE